MHVFPSHGKTEVCVCVCVRDGETQLGFLGMAVIFHSRLPLLSAATCWLRSGSPGRG